VVEELKVSVGERLSQGQEVAKIVDLYNLRIEAPVLEHDLPYIKVGGDATITAAAAPDRPIRGRVAAILPLVDSVTRAGRAVIRATGNGVLRPGMYADVRLCQVSPERGHSFSRHRGPRWWSPGPPQCE